MEVESTKVDENPFSLPDLRDVVSSDLTIYLNQFRDKSKGLQIASSRMKVHTRTLSRLILKDNKPTYMTLYKIYRVLLNVSNDTELLEECPNIVKEALIKNNPKALNQNIEYSIDLEKEISKCSVFSEIYFTATAGSISKGFIEFRFGNLGEEIVERMLKTQILVSNKERDVFFIGNIQSNISSATIKKVGLQFCERYSKPENADLSGNNYSAFFIEGLSENTYNEWLKIDEDAFRKKIELTRNKESLGDIKAFTYMVTDTNTPSKAVQL
jgi:hypothetical protein